MKHSHIPVAGNDLVGLNRRLFLQAMTCSVAAGGLMLGVPPLYGAQEDKKTETPEIKTNIDEYMKVARGKHAIPGPFPGKVVKVTDPACLKEDAFDGEVIREMVHKGIQSLTGQTMKESFKLFFTPEDVVGLKVNPVGAPLINTRHEVTRAVIDWLVACGLPKKNIVIWDRFQESLDEAGYTAENYPGIRIEGLQTFKVKEEGGHESVKLFDQKAYYFAEGIQGTTGDEKQDAQYLMQHVFTGEYSYFGNLISKKLTKIINIPAYKNTGNGVSMATKNLAYAAICNTARLHRPLFFRVCTEVMAAPWIRDKLVLNILDGLRGQYEGGPGKNAQFVYANHALYFATDPIALDMIGHTELVEKRKAMEVKVVEHPRYTAYLHDAEKLGLGVADKDKLDLVEVEA